MRDILYIIYSLAALVRTTRDARASIKSSAIYICHACRRARSRLLGVRTYVARRCVASGQLTLASRDFRGRGPRQRSSPKPADARANQPPPLPLPLLSGNFGLLPLLAVDVLRLCSRGDRISANRNCEASRDSSRRTLSVRVV